MFRVSLIVFAVLLLLLTLLSAYGGSLQGARAAPETFLQGLPVPTSDSSRFFGANNEQQEQEERSIEYFMTSSGGVPASQLSQPVPVPVADNDTESQALESGGFMVEPFEEESYAVPAQF